MSDVAAGVNVCEREVERERGVEIGREGGRRRRRREEKVGREDH